MKWEDVGNEQRARVYDALADIVTEEACRRDWWKECPWRERYAEHIESKRQFIMASMAGATYLEGLFTFAQYAEMAPLSARTMLVQQLRLREGKQWGGFLNPYKAALGAAASKLEAEG